MERNLIDHLYEELVKKPCKLQECQRWLLKLKGPMEKSGFEILISLNCLFKRKTVHSSIYFFTLDMNLTNQLNTRNKGKRE